MGGEGSKKAMGGCAGVHPNPNPNPKEGVVPRPMVRWSEVSPASSCALSAWCGLGFGGGGRRPPLSLIGNLC